MPRIKGSKPVNVNGQVMTTRMYRQAVINTLQKYGNNFMTVNQIVNSAADAKMCEKKNAPRRAATHPMWKIISLMMDEENCPLIRIKNQSGRWMYKLKNPGYIYIDGYKCRH